MKSIPLFIESCLDCPFCDVGYVVYCEHPRVNKSNDSVHKPIHTGIGIPADMPIPEWCPLESINMDLKNGAKR